MKTFQTSLRSIFVAASLILLASCSKDDAPVNNIPVVPANSSYVRGTVAGAAYSSLIASCSVAGSGTDRIITILGGDMGANSLTVVLYGIDAPGSYSVNNTTNSVLNYSPGSGGVAYSTGECDAASGTITITAIDATHVEGTFSFTGKDTENCDTGATKTVTNGTFKGVFPS
jgi:hypothetical protein